MAGQQVTYTCKLVPRFAILVLKHCDFGNISKATKTNQIKSIPRAIGGSCENFSNVKSGSGCASDCRIINVVRKRSPAEGAHCPSNSEMCSTVIDKSQPIESIGSRLRDHTRTFDSSVRARPNPEHTASFQFRWLAQPLLHGLFVREILVFLLFRGKLTKRANHGMRQDAVHLGECCRKLCSGTSSSRQSVDHM